MGELTFSRRLGYLDQGGDIDGTLVALDQELTYRAVVRHSQLRIHNSSMSPLTLF